MALSPQDVADCVNSLNITKEDFTKFLTGASLLAQRNAILAQIETANATANTAATTATTTIAGLNAQLKAVDDQFRTLYGG